jgi:hypothetical protein
VTSIMLLDFKRQISMQNTPSEITDLEQSQTSKNHKRYKGDALAIHNTKRNGDSADYEHRRRENEHLKAQSENSTHGENQQE